MQAPHFKKSQSPTRHRYSINYSGQGQNGPNDLGQTASCSLSATFGLEDFGAIFEIWAAKLEEAQHHTKLEVEVGRIGLQHAKSARCQGAGAGSMVAMLVCSKYYVYACARSLKLSRHSGPSRRFKHREGA